MYKPVQLNVKFPKLEEAILKFWQENQVFEKSLAKNKGQEEYIFYDGPPFATGLPHFGHFVPNTLKDIIPRYQTMKGKYVSRRFGWDCHGLPVEVEVEKELGLSGKKEIEAYGVADFNEKCRSIVLRFSSQWREIISRLGRWVDFDNDYKTMDIDYMESIWWVLKELWNKDLLYKAHYILPSCPRCSTIISNNELALGGYKDVYDPAITVKFALSNEPDTFFCAWTTTPWTLVANLALAVGPELNYVKVKHNNQFFILIENAAEATFGEDLEIIWTKKGAELAGIEYQPVFDYFSDEKSKGAFQVYAADYVTSESGTGIVHTAPGFGEDDYQLLKNTAITTHAPVDAECCYTGEITEYQGRYVQDCNKDIIQNLKAKDLLIKQENYLHPYPHCWRCQSPLIYRAVDSWFVKVTAIKEQLIANNEQINWVPDHVKQGRFGQWIGNARDWSISRNRYWGNPIPIWECNECKHQDCLGSRSDLEEKTGQSITDLHKHIVDELTYPCPQASCQGSMQRVPEVLDCWFESGAMPYAQLHYPFENKQDFNKHLPASFISEGLDQTRGWFYSLHVLATALFDTPAFKNVIVNGLVLASDGKKMSKSLRNYSDPLDVINEFGADALRLFLMKSNVVKAEGLRYSDNGVKDMLKKVILPFWNAYSFFVTYANTDNITPQSAPKQINNPLDIWILSTLETLVENVSKAFENYEVQKSVEAIIEFINLLNNWYIRRSRRRFWKSENDGDKINAYDTLWHVLITLSKVAAPVIPFTCEEIYRNLKLPTDPISVHLCDYPEVSYERKVPELERSMFYVLRVISLGRSLRAAHNLKVRQPLKCLYIITKASEEKQALLEMKEIIQEELNMKEIVFKDNEEELITYSAKANFKTLGKILGKDMKLVASQIATLTSKEIQQILEGATLTLSFDGIEHQSLDVVQDFLDIRREKKDDLIIENEDSVTIALETRLNEALIQEGEIRDIIRFVQNQRKTMDLDLSDRISLVFTGDASLKDTITNFSEYLQTETLTEKWEWQETAVGGTELIINDKSLLITLSK